MIVSIFEVIGSSFELSDFDGLSKFRISKSLIRVSNNQFSPKVEPSRSGAADWCGRRRANAEPRSVSHTFTGVVFLIINSLLMFSINWLGQRQ